MGKHSIIIIKNKDNKYLQYYDNNWDSYLFLNCKMNNKDDIDSISRYLKEKINVSEFNYNFLGEKTHTKYSQKDKKQKEYTHYFYKIETKEEISDNELKWLSYDELINDMRIKEVNSDIIEFVRELDL